MMRYSQIVILFCHLLFVAVIPVKGQDLEFDKLVYIYETQYNDNELDNALITLNKILEIDRNHYGESDTIYSELLKIKAELLEKMQKYDSAIVVYLKILKIEKLNYPKNHPSTIETLEQLAKLYFTTANIQNAIDVNMEIISICETDTSNKRNALANSFNRLGIVYVAMARYETAMLYYEKALISYKTSENNSYDYQSDVLSNLANLYLNKGDYKKALEYFEKSYYYYKLQGDTTLEREAIYANNMGRMNLQTGAYDKALANFEEAKYLYLQLLEYNSNAVAMCINNIALVELSNDNYSLALSLFNEAYVIKTKIFPLHHPENLQTYLNIGMVYFKMDSLEKANSIFTEILSVNKTLYPNEHPILIGNYFVIGATQWKLGFFQEAIDYFESCMKISENTYGTNYPTKSIYYLYLGYVYEDLGNIQKSQMCFSEYIKFRKQFIKTNIFLLDNQDELTFMAREGMLSDSYESVIYRKQNEKDINKIEVFNNSVYHNSYILRKNQLFKNILANSNDSILISSYYKLSNLYKEYNRAIAKTIKTQSEQQLNIKYLEHEISQCERELSLKSNEFRIENDKLNIDFNEITKHLKPNQAYIMFNNLVYFNGRKWTDSTLYAAYLVRSEFKEPIILYPFEQKSLDSLLSFKDPIAGVKSLYSNDDLFNLIWKPQMDYLKGVEEIYYTPSGSLNKIAFGALMDSSGVFLSSRFTLHQITGPSQIVFPNAPDIFSEKNSNNKDIALFGGINYYADTTSIKQMASNFISDTTNNLATRSIILENLDRGNIWKSLPGTFEEVEGISRLLRENGYSSIQFTGINALEEQIKDLTNENAPKIIHIASHGYFIQDPKLNQKNNPVELMIEQPNSFQSAGNPMMRSGLLFAGAVNTWKGELPTAVVEDGVLTAMEVANLNLSNTKLVVLSACETALGDIKSKEGVFGLQRAFKLAGVDFIIMSLWRIPDKETSEFMINFYTHLIKENNIPSAFTKAQKEMKEKYKEDPYKWAGLVLVE